MEPVRSTRNRRVAEAVRLHRARDRRRLGRTIIEGPNVVSEAIGAGIEVECAFGVGPAPDGMAGIDWVEVTPEVLRHLSDTAHPRGPVAVMAIPPPAVIDRDHFHLDVSDPGNAGTLIRSAAAFGLDVTFGEGSVDPWSPKVLRAAAGAHFHTSIGEAVPAVATIATVVAGGVRPDRLGDVLDPSRIWAVLVGSEAHGLGPVAVAGADVAVSIPMRGGVESLNAAAAGAIVAYELGQWRQAVGGPSTNR
jgi:TrmH family RNA methyltransferase